MSVLVLFVIMPQLRINTYVSLMCELKKNLKYLRVNLLGPGPLLWKKNLPGRGLTKVEKHFCIQLYGTVLYSFYVLFATESLCNFHGFVYIC